MRKDKYNKPFMPGQIEADKQKREQAKAKALAKKARKMGIEPEINWDELKVEVADVKKAFEYMGRFLSIDYTVAEQALDRTKREKEEEPKFQVLAVPSVSGRLLMDAPPRQLQEKAMADDNNSSNRLTDLASGQKFQIDRSNGEMRIVPLGPDSQRKNAEDIMKLMSFAFGFKPLLPRERTFDDLAEEFEDLMENHERLMNHFK